MTYIGFKNKLCRENILSALSSENINEQISRFRVSSHRQGIDTWWHQKPRFPLEQSCAGTVNPEK